MRFFLKSNIMFTTEAQQQMLKEDLPTLHQTQHGIPFHPRPLALTAQARQCHQFGYQYMKN
jgi:hypothetical protein